MRRSSCTVTAGAVALACLLMPAQAPAAIPGDCTALGIAITEHSCFHSEFGPFTTVMATAGATIAVGTPDINPVHTEYRVGLAGEFSVVTYTPRRTGAWAVLLGNDLPLQVIPTQGDALTSILDQSGSTGCAALPVLHVFELTANTKYQLVFGPTAERSAVAVIEYIDDFLTENGRDDDGDGFGSKQEIVVTPCLPPAGFAPNTRDCNDLDALVNPNAIEVCDGVDQNCNGVADDIGLVCRVGLGGCRVEGKTECPSGGGEAVCAAEPAPGTTEACNGRDDDCNGAIDDGPGLCPEAARPTCVRSGMTATCGCQLDLDCGPAASGRLCNVAQGRCEDGCSGLPGGNGCVAGELCNPKTSRCELRPNEGGASGIAGAASAGAGAVTVAGAPPDATEPTEGGAPTAPEPPATTRTSTSGGCDCAVAGRQRLAGWPLLLVAACALWRRRSAARRIGSVALLAASIWGCGGRVQDTVATSGGSPMAPNGGQSQHDHPDHAGSAAQLPASGGAAGASGALEPACEPALDHEPIEHACSHVTNGPFVPAVTGGGIATPDVSELHHTYEVQVVGAGAALHYRAQRSGAHAFMTDTPATLRVSHDGQALSLAPSFDVVGCPHLTRASAYDLVPEEEYEVTLLESASELRFFVEHLAAFGDEAWEMKCSEADAP